MSRLQSAIALSIICLPVSGQEQGSGSDSSAALGPGEVAFVGDQRIPESVFRLFTLSLMQVNADDLPPEARAQVIDRLVFLELLNQEAERTGMHRERRIAAELELARMQVLARNMTTRFAERNPPTENELVELYEASLPELRLTQYRTRHILVDSEEEARTALNELNGGEDFADLALQYSVGPTAAEGGDLGWITPDAVGGEFGAALPNATPGVPLPDPVQSDFGWHVVLVEEVQEGAAPDFETVRADLITALDARKLTEFLQALGEEVGVEFVE